VTTFVDRAYEDVVRDVLTNLTQGVAGEAHHVDDYDTTARPVVVPDIALERRPVRRVSRVAGVLAPATPDDDPVPYEFSLNDYELVAATDDPTDMSTIRFLPFGKKPAPDSDVVVSYYPRNVDPAPVNDVNVGSVVRTLVEAVSKELAIVYKQLNQAYDSAYVGTAAGSSLDRVVALLGLERYKAGRPVGTVRFGRRAGSTGTIAIPPGTPVTDGADKVRYETSEAHTMLAGESTAEVRVRGATGDTPVVEAGTLTVVQRAIAGIDTVTNPSATTTAAQDESDDELRGRARTALTASNKGTLGALQNGLLQLPDVRAVAITEFPNGVPGELALSISLTDPSQPAIPAAVLARVEELRPAGVRVVPDTAAKVALAVQVSLVLAGSHLASTEIEQLHGQVRKKLVDLVAKTGVGARVRTGPLVSAILGDERIVDATLRLGAKGGTPGAAGADFVPDPDQTVELAGDDVSFEPDAFDQPLPAGGGQIPVDVQAVVPVTPAGGADLVAVQTQLQGRLTSYFGALAPGATVDAPTLLSALRDDSNYAIDPLGLMVTLAADRQFVQIAQGGPAFTVKPGHAFTVSSVVATASEVPA
jgi:uncharacterized phage protein gp47/JayE